MSPSLLKILYFLLFFSLHGVPLLAGSTKSQIRFNTITTSDGLSNNNVNSIVKDNMGFIWVATNDGLCRYDAHQNFKVYKPDPAIPNGLQSSDIRTLHIDHNNIIWIGTRLGGLTRFDPAKGIWKTYNHNKNDKNSLSNNEILSILEDSKSRLWIGTENGLNLFNPETETFTHFHADKEDSNSLQSKAILSIMEDNKGWIWVGTWAGGLHLMIESEDGDIAKNTFKNFLPSDQKPSHNVWDIYQDHSDRYWLGTHGGGLFLMELPEETKGNSDKKTLQATFFNYKHNSKVAKSISDNVVRNMFEDKQGRLWIATINGLCLIDLNQLSPRTKGNQKPKINFTQHFFDPSNPLSLSHNDINQIYEDSQGIIWVGTLGGISIYNWHSSQFEVYELFTQMSRTPNCENLYIDKNGIGWFGVGQKGLIKYDFKNDIASLFDNNNRLLKDGFASALYSPDHLNLYIGTRDGVSVLNLETQKVKHYPVPKSILEKLTNFVVLNIYTDKKGKIWLGTEHGLFIINEKDGSYTSYYHDTKDKNSISDNSVNGFFEDSNGFLWISTFNGLNKTIINEAGEISFITFKHDAQKPDKSISSNRITSIEEINGILYLGTNSGLSRYDLDKEEFFPFSKGKNKFRFQSLEVSNDGNLWGSTLEGLFYFNPKTKAFNIFEKEDGLGDITFRLSSSYKDQEGNLYFGSRKGITRVRPESIIKNETSPSVFITDLRIMNPDGQTNLSGIQQKPIELKHDDYYLSINFVGLNYNRIEKNQFAYKLEGFDESWIYTNSSAPIVYTNLDHGTYTFKVKAANNDGLWNETGSELSIIKKPAFWQTWWFILGCILAVASTVLLILYSYTKTVRIRNLALRRYNENLSKEINERKRFEIALKERERFLLLLMNNIPQHIYWVDKEHKIQGANDMFLQTLNLEKEELLKGKILEDFYAPSNFTRTQKRLEAHVLQSEKAVYNDILEIPANNFHSNLWMEQHYIPLRDESDKVIGVLISAQDITAKVAAEEVLKTQSKNLETMVEQRTHELAIKNKEVKSLLQNIKSRNEELEAIVEKRTQKLSESNKELMRSNNDLEQFAYIASHDLKEPLRMIGNFVGLLSRRYKNQLDQNAFEYIDFVEDGVFRMSGLINSLLTYSRVGRKETEFNEVNLGNTIEVKLFDLSALIKDRKVDIQIDPMPFIYCEKNQLGMVFYNLINNAIKFNKSENPVIKITNHQNPPEGFWQFSVSDNGIGIAPEYKDQIFEIFRRLHTKQEYEGTGIGLALCHKIIDRHGGKIWIESSLGEGTTFYLTIAKNLKEVSLERTTITEDSIGLPLN